MFDRVILTLVSFVVVTSALVVRQPRETAYSESAVRSGWTPRPTSPSLAELAKRELEKRAYLTACAYFSFNASNTITWQCNPPYYCNYATNVDGVYNNNFMQCCPVSSGAFVSGCIPDTTCLGAAAAGSYCAGGVCGNATKVCDQTGSTECITVVAEISTSPFTGWACGPSAYEAYGVFTLPSTTMSPSTSSVTTPSSSSTSPSPTTSSSSSPSPTTSSSSSPSPTTSSSSSPSPTTSSSTTPYPPSASTSTPPQPDNDNTSDVTHSHVGAIAGGAIAGVAAIAILVIAIWYIRHRINKKNEERRADHSPEMTGFIAGNK